MNKFGIGLLQSSK